MVRETSDPPDVDCHEITKPGRRESVGCVRVCGCRARVAGVDGRLSFDLPYPTDSLDPVGRQDDRERYTQRAMKGDDQAAADLVPAVNQMSPGQRQSGEDKKHRAAGDHAGAVSPADPNVLMHEVAEEDADEWVESPMQTPPVSRGEERITTGFLKACACGLTPPDEGTGEDAQSQQRQAHQQHRAGESGVTARSTLALCVPGMPGSTLATHATVRISTTSMICSPAEIALITTMVFPERSLPSVTSALIATSIVRSGWL